jgi:hypothetical protein
VGPGTQAALAIRLRIAEGADRQTALRTAAASLSEHLGGLVTGGVELSGR